MCGQYHHSPQVVQAEIITPGHERLFEEKRNSATVQKVVRFAGAYG